MMNVSRDTTPKTEDPDGALKARNEERDMLWVRDTIIRNPDSYFTKNFFRTHAIHNANTTYNAKILATYPALEQFRPIKRVAPECIWCKRGGKHKLVYTSHWMFDKNKSLTCPKLLKEQCRNCGELGHVMGKHCGQPQKARQDLLPPRKLRMFNYRDTSDYASGDSEDYMKFRLSDATDDDDDDSSSSDEDATETEALPGFNEIYQWPNRIACKQATCSPDVPRRCITITKLVREIASPVVEEKTPPPKKTWASIVSSK